MSGAGVAKNEVDSDLMMEHLAELARWTKLSGNQDEAESLRYVEKQMASYGYATRILHHPAYISLPGPARVIADGVEMKAITHSMGQPSPKGGLTAPVIHVGQGTDADFNGKDVRGAIVLVEGMATPPVALRASKAGAAGQLHISANEHMHEMCISPVWGNPDTQTMADMPTTVAATISAADGKAIRDRLAHGEKPSVTIHAEVDTGWRPTPLLVADMAAPGADADTPFVLFSGHHDTWYQGVMDNGSANCTMMEVARLQAQNRAGWKRNLRFCFWSGHSHGRYSGSSWYADTHWMELERLCAVHVNVDSTGGLEATNLDEAPAATELAKLADDALRTVTGRGFQGKRLARNSDQSFWGIGIPSIFTLLSAQSPDKRGVRNNLGWWWHTPHDLIDKIDPALLTRDTQIYHRLIDRLLTDIVLPLDIAAQAADLNAALKEIALGDDAGIPFGDLVREAAELETACAALASAKGGSDARRTNQLLMRLSRALVPIDYTSGARFAHDPALPQRKWPALEPLRRFAAEPGHSPRWNPMQVEARRALNIVRSAVRQARLALQDGRA